MLQGTLSCRCPSIHFVDSGTLLLRSSKLRVVACIHESLLMYGIMEQLRRREWQPELIVQALLGELVDCSRQIQAHVLYGILIKVLYTYVPLDIRKLGCGQEDFIFGFSKMWNDQFF